MSQPIFISVPFPKDAKKGDLKGLLSWIDHQKIGERFMEMKAWCADAGITNFHVGIDYTNNLFVFLTNDVAAATMFKLRWY